MPLTLHDANHPTTPACIVSVFLLCCVQIWNHPDILYQFVAQRKEDNDLDLDDAKPVDMRDGYGNNSPMTVMQRSQQRSRFPRSYTSTSLDEMIGRVEMNKKDSIISYDWVGGLM